MKKILFVWILLNVTVTYAQHLPNVQKESIFLSSPIIIDGRYDDWKNDFKAYNNATSVFYAIANNDDNLFIVIKVPPSSTSMVFSKVFAGGATITFKNAILKKSSTCLTFPVMAAKDRTKILKIKNDTPFVGTQILNQVLSSYSKNIKVSGFERSQDSVISIGNNYGIAAAAGFDDGKFFTLEISIPLKYLKSSIKNDNQLDYNIRLNPYPLPMGLPPGQNENQDKLLQMAIDANPRFAERITPTDFSATYILAKKP